MSSAAAELEQSNALALAIMPPGTGVMLLDSALIFLLF
jgi:hypothetical protein